MKQNVLRDNAQGCWYSGCAGSLVLHQPNPSEAGSASVRLCLVASWPWTMMSLYHWLLMNLTAWGDRPLIWMK